MNYNHNYHAGNFADVVKHSILTVRIDYLHLKNTPLCYIDTHAGGGLYDLKSNESQKTGEASLGIQRLMNYAGKHPACLDHYFQGLTEFTKGRDLTHYPGSPLFAYKLLREDDRMILNEYHPAVYQQLKNNFYATRNVTIHQRDAYEFLPAILPPKPARGLILIDPPFESKTEHQQLKACLQKSLQRWPTGIYLIWYPVTTTARWDLQELLPKGSNIESLTVEFTVSSRLTQAKGLIGSNLLILNPPWKIQEKLAELLAHLWKILAVDRQGRWQIS